MKLVGYWSEQECADQLGVAVPTLRTWSARRKGPPRVTYRRMVIYRIVSVMAWLERREIDPEAESQICRRRRKLRRAGEKAA